MKVNTTLRIDDNAIKYYKDNYKSNHAGCVLAVEGYPHLREETLALLKDKFRPQEIKFLRNASNNGKISPRQLASRRHWEAEIGDYYEIYAPKCAPDSVDFTTLIGKIRELSPIERFVLRETTISSK